MRNKLINLLKGNEGKLLEVEVKELTIDSDVEVTFARSSHKRNKSGWANKKGILFVYDEDFQNNEDTSKERPQ